MSVRKALVVGIDNYPRAPLHGCVNDAVAVARLLESNDSHFENSYDLNNFSVDLLTAGAHDITRRGLRKQLENLFTGGRGSRLFYFAGHGCLTNVGGYIVTSDGQSYDEGISMAEILILASRCDAEQKIFILDCCHSGAMGAPPLLKDEHALLGPDTVILAACQTSERAEEIAGRGVFTSLVVDALEGGAADLRGFVTTASLYAYVDQALGPMDQRPVFRSNVAGFPPLRKLRPPIDPKDLRKLTKLFPIPTKQFLLNPSFEPTDKAAIPDNCEQFAVLQRYARVNIVVPVGEEHMYYAAINSKSCRLTALGQHYWRLVAERKLQ